MHCSCPGKSAEDVLFPDDLRNASELCANGAGLSCSVIWPQHIETFGAIGIVLRPRSTESIQSLHSGDAGSSCNSKTGEREGFGSEFSRSAVHDTFEKAVGYNEWTVKDADTIGIFVNPKMPLVVAMKVSMANVPGYEQGMPIEDIIGPCIISIADASAAFPGCTIYTYTDKEIVELDPANGSVRGTVDVSTLYGLK